jgi:hypothetical protein
MGKLKLRYKILQTSLFICYSICFMDIVMGLILNYYPMLNFILRGFIIIFLIRSLRQAWLNIFYVIWRTKSVFFILFFNMCVFALIGHLIFSEVEEFDTFFSSLDSMFILLTTCNFPDVMLSTFQISKLFSLIFFTAYLLFNFLVMLSLLKALYYSNYFEINKARAIKIIKDLKYNPQGRYRKDTIKHFLEIVIKKFSLSGNESNRIVDLIKYKEDVSDVRINNSNMSMNSYASNDNGINYNSSRLLKYLRMKRVEIIVNIINLALVGFLFIDTENLTILIIQMISCFYFIGEYALYLSYLSFARLFITKLMRSIFFIINLLGFLCILIIIFFEIFKLEGLSTLIMIAKPLIILRAMRVLILLNTFSEFKFVFVTLHNMKTIFYSLLATQFSFFFMFSSISMLIIGGKIKYNMFDDIKTIPNAYDHINFNDFGSSFLTCFSLMMVNNMNILTTSLSYPHLGILKAYFCSFYFLGTLIILNICQTFILDMYLNIKNSMQLK